MVTNLTESEIVDVKRRLVAGEDYLAIARSIGRTPACVWKIARGRSHARVIVEGFVPAAPRYQTKSSARKARLNAEKAKADALGSSLALAMSWGAALSAELDRLRASVGVIQPRDGGSEWAGEEVVYFVQNRVGETKIGTTRNLHDRMRSLRGESGGARLIAAVVGGPSVEAEWHQRHATLRTTHEWFRLTADHIPATDISVARFNPARGRRRSFCRVCLGCEKDFVANVEHRVYCSKGCLAHATGQRRKRAA